ncbi:MAG: PD40 domain-containing protein [Solirubrobacterales bacterium]|nr:PD40 domain-containing protein [Solirubrobacterales bacterium]
MISVADRCQAPAGSRRSRILWWVTALAASLATLSLGASTAAGATGHAFLSELSPAPTSVSSAAVDGAGKVFVARAGSAVVDVYSGGKLLTSFGAGILGKDLPSLTVDDSGRVYVADREANTVDVFEPAGQSYVLLSRWTGAALGGGTGFGEVTGVAVDDSGGATAGVIYLLDQSESAVDVFAPQPSSGAEPALLRTLKGKPSFEEPDAVAVNGSTGEVYVATEASSGFVVEVFSPSGALVRKITGKETPTRSFGSVLALAVDRASGDLYVVDGENRAVDEFDAAGKWIGWLPVANAKPFGEPVGVAVASSGELFVADAAPPGSETAAVDVFAADAIVPDATTEKASKVERDSAVLNGTVNPDETEAKSSAGYFFEYAEASLYEANREYNAKTPELSGANGDAPTKISELVTNLKPDTEYDYRLVARNTNGVSYGSNLEFETPPAVSGLSTGPTTELQPETAKLTGSINGPLGNPKLANPGATYHFDYGTSPAYGKSTPEVRAPEASGPIAAEAQPTGLLADTVYHYRLVASDSFGTTFGEDRVFKTPGPPQITSELTTAITHTSATVNAQIDPGERATEYFVEYGETTDYGTSTAKVELPAGEHPVAVAVSLSGLKLAGSYHFRFVATNSTGTVQGPDQQFTTAVIASESVKELTPESAVLQAEIDPQGIRTTYRFEYGETAAYGTSIPANTSEEEEKAVSGEAPTVVEAKVSGLRPARTYHYRVVATVAGLGAGAGADRSFTTPASATGAAFALPDDRSYEMVSPPNKGGGYIEALNRVGGAIQASANGDAFAFVVDGPIVEDPEGNRSPLPEQALSNRGPEEWRSQQIVAPHERAYGASVNIPPEFQLFSADLALSIMQPYPFGLTPLAEPPLSPPLTDIEREVVKEEREPERLNQEKTIYLRADAPLAPNAAEATIFGEATRNGEVLAGEHGESTPRPGYLPLVTAANVPAGTKFGGTPIESTHKGFPPTRVAADLSFRYATPELTHAVLSSHSIALAPSGPSAPGLYEWSANKLQLVSVLPDGLPGPPAGPSTSESRLGFESASRSTNFRNSISSDGARVFWSISEGGENHEAGVGSLYMRDTTLGETVRIDLPEPGVAGNETGRAQFQTASTDGSKVFFTDTRRLTADSSARTESAVEHVPAEPDLYECEIQEEGGALKPCKLRDLTAQRAGESGSVQGLVQGASQDGSTIYFVADGALVPGASRGNCGAVAFPPAGAACNLYRMHEAAGKWSINVVGRLSREDAPDWFNTQQNTKLLVDMTARVSPNGRYLAFMSNQRLTGYDNTDVNEIEARPGEGRRHADEEVFLYDGDTGTLTCASCNPTGARPRGVFDAEIAGEGPGLTVDRPQVWVSETGGSHFNDGIDHWLAGNIPGWTAQIQQAAIYQSRYLSNEGRLFFNSADAIVPRTAHLTRMEPIAGSEVSVGVENVYQFEPNAVGSCTTATGCLAMISSGTSDKESAFLDASVSGEDVFFLTAAQELARDRDTAFDVYVARVCSTASPCQLPGSTPAAACAENATCRPGATSTQPGFQPPATSTFSGPGNLSQPLPTGNVLPAKSRTITRAQKLRRALKICRALPHKTRAQKLTRHRCEAGARKRYGAKRAAKHPQGGKR